MRTFKFDELPEEVKQKVIWNDIPDQVIWNHIPDPFPRMNQYEESVNAFCERFRVDFDGIEFTTGDHTNPGGCRVLCCPYENKMPTISDDDFLKWKGYIEAMTEGEMLNGDDPDFVLWCAFLDHLKTGSSIYVAFLIAISAIRKNIDEAVEYYYSEEGIEKLIMERDLDFNEDGTIHG